MRTPEVITIEVVLDQDKRKFKLPDGSLKFEILAGQYGSWRPYKDRGKAIGFEKEIDTPFIVFRDDEYFDRGICTYIFGSDGYHVVEGLSQIETGSDHLTFMYAKWFKPGDVISFVRIPSAREIKQRGKLDEGRQ